MTASSCTAVCVARALCCVSRVLLRAQGIATKVKQAAAAALGQLLPPSRRGELLPLLRVDGGSSELMPHAGIAAGSSTSEAATAAITAACELLLERLRPAAEKLAAAPASKAAEAGNAAEAAELTWQAIIKAVAQTVPFASPKVRGGNSWRRSHVLTAQRACSLLGWLGGSSGTH